MLLIANLPLVADVPIAPQAKTLTINFRRVGLSNSPMFRCWSISLNKSERFSGDSDNSETSQLSLKLPNQFFGDFH